MAKMPEANIELNVTYPKCAAKPPRPDLYPSHVGVESCRSCTELRKALGDSIEREASLLTELKSLKEREGECIHCGDVVTNADIDHWRTCEKHPAHAENAALEQQVANLEEYMLKGVAFRDELQSRLALLGKAIDKHRCAIWGINGKVAHDQDVILYAALEEVR